MADLSFDDLIPQAPATQPAPSAALSFDDLVPQAPGQPQPAPVGGMAGALMAAQPAQQAQDSVDPMQLYYGAARSVDNMGLAAARILGIPATQTYDFIKGHITGEPTTEAQSLLNQHVLTPLKARADSLAPRENDSLPNKLMNAGGGFAGTLAAMAATGGLSRAPAVADAVATGTLPRVLGEVGQAARTMAVPATTDAVNTGHDVYAETGDLAAALKAGAATGAADVGMGLLPAALPGNLATRLASGAPVGALTGEGARQLRNMALPETMQTPFNAQDAIVNGLTGSVLAGALGRAPERPAATPQPDPLQQPAPVPQQAQQAPATGLHAQVMDAMQGEQQAPALPVPKTPFAGSVDINATLDNLGLQGERRTKALDLLRPVEPDVEARRRGVVSNAEQTQLANLIGLDGAQALIHGRKLGQTFNAEEFRAVNSAVQAQMTNVLDLQQRIAKGQATDLEKAQFVTDLAGMRHASGELLGAKAEAGRAMAALRRTTLDHKQALAILESVGGVSGADDLAKAIGAAIQSGGLANAAKVMRKGNHLTDYIKAGWLYDPTTHVANMAGNTGMLGINTADRLNAAVLAGSKRLFGLKGETMWSEPLALLSGAIRGQMKAIGATGRAFATGESPMLGAGKLEQSSLPQRTMPGKLGTAKLVGDNIALLPFRALGAEDAYFATTNYEAQVRALAHRTAFAEKKSGSLPQGMTVSKRIDQLANDPTPQMIEDAGDYARESTFNQAAGPIAAKVLAAKAAVPWLNVIVPFVRTPMNVISRVLKGSPAGVLYPSVWRDIRAGGAKQEMAIAKMMSGTQAMIGAGLLAQAGYLTGAGPSDNKERDAWLAAGNQPWSVKINGTWHGYNRLDPFAAWAGLASDMVNMKVKDQDAEKVALKLVASFAENIVSKTWMQGVEGLSQALSDPDRYAGSFLSRTAASVLQPNALLSGAASRQDEYARKPDSFMDAMKVRLPGLRESVPVRQDSWGEPMANNRYADNAFNAVAPMTHSKESTDPVRLEAARIGWAPGDAPKHMTLQGKEFPLSAEQQAEFNELSGALIHRAAKQLIRSKAWRLMDDDQRRESLGKVSDKSRAAVRLALAPLLLKNNRRPLDNLRKRLRK